MNNIPSMLKRGILSHNQARTTEHESCAMQEIQDRRIKIRVPGGMLLHDYVNLYFHARNPMMYKRRGIHESLGVIAISPNVLDIPGTVIADCNAASDIVMFKPSPKGLEFIDSEKVYAESWIHPSDPIETHRHRLIKCAEVLVPTRVKPEHILRIYVSCEKNLVVFEKLVAPIRNDVHIIEYAYLFFR